MKVSSIRFAGLGLLALAPIAGAQEAAAVSDVLTEVVVTAKKDIEEKLQEEAKSITVFNEAELAKANVVNASDLARITPSLSVNSNFGNENTSFAFRGFSQDTGTHAAVVVYFADVAAPRAANNGVQVGDGAGPGMFFDLENVIILHGPQGVDGGRNATGGAIKFVPKKPTKEFEADVELSAGNYDMRRVQTAINLPFTDSTSFRLSGDFQKRDGYVRNNIDKYARGAPNVINTIVADTGDDFYDVNYYALRASFVWDITDNLETYFIGSYSKSDTHGSIQKVISCSTIDLGNVFPCHSLQGTGTSLVSSGQVIEGNVMGDDFYDVQSTIKNPSSMLETWQVVNTTAWAVSDSVTVKNTLGYAELTDDLHSGLFGTYFTSPPNSVIFPIPFAYVSPPPAGVHTYVIRDYLKAGPNDILVNPDLFLNQPIRYNNNDPNDPIAVNARNIQYIDPANTLTVDNGEGHTAHQSTFSEELKIEGDGFSSRLTYLAGAYFEESLPLSKTGNQSPFLLRCTDEVNFQLLSCTDQLGHGYVSSEGVGFINYSVGETEYRSKGLYSQAAFQVIDPLTIRGGYRYAWDKQENTSTLITWVSAAPAVNNAPLVPYCGDRANEDELIQPWMSPTGCAVSIEKETEAPTWLLGLDYEPSEDALIYGKYNRGYRPGGVIIGAPRDKRYFEEEQVDSYELGVKLDFPVVLRRLNVTAFYNDYINRQLQLAFASKRGSLLPHTVAIVNAGKSESQGLEVETVLELAEGLTFQVNYTYLDTEITALEQDQFKTVQPEYSETALFEVGNPLLFSPKNKLSASLNYTMSFDTAGKLSLGLTYLYTDEMLTTYSYNDEKLYDPNEPRYVHTFASTNPCQCATGAIPAHSTYNANIEWDSIMGWPLTLSLFVTNLTDEKYYTHIAGVIIGGFETASLGEPRMFGGRLRYQFGK